MDTRVNIDKNSGDQLFEMMNKKYRMSEGDIPVYDAEGMIMIFRENEV